MNLIAFPGLGIQLVEFILSWSCTCVTHCPIVTSLLYPPSLLLLPPSTGLLSNTSSSAFISPSQVKIMLMKENMVVCPLSIIFPTFPSFFGFLPVCLSPPCRKLCWPSALPLGPQPLLEALFPSFLITQILAVWIQELDGFRCVFLETGCYS